MNISEEESKKAALTELKKEFAKAALILRLKQYDWREIVRENPKVFHIGYRIEAGERVERTLEGYFKI